MLFYNLIKLHAQSHEMKIITLCGRRCMQDKTQPYGSNDVDVMPISPSDHIKPTSKRRLPANTPLYYFWAGRSRSCSCRRNAAHPASQSASESSLFAMPFRTIALCMHIIYIIRDKMTKHIGTNNMRARKGKIKQNINR
jgi:hypothetical protein